MKINVLSNNHIPDLLEIQYNTGIEINRNLFEDCVKNPHIFYGEIALANNGKPVSYYIIETANPVEVIEIATHKDFQRKGIASRLLSRVGDCIAYVPDTSEYLGAQQFFKSCRFIAVDLDGSDTNLAPLILFERKMCNVE